MNYRFSLFNRIWHWSMVISFMVLIVTVILRNTLLDQFVNAELIQATLKKIDIHITQDQAFKINDIFAYKVWGIHIYAGYFLIFLTVLKLFHMIKNSYFVSEKSQNRHELFRNIFYFIIFLSIIIMLLSGISILFLEVSPQISYLLEKIHGTLGFVLFGLVFFHISGVIHAEIFMPKLKGIVSKMIGGEKNKKN